MSAFNAVNGDLACESKFLITQVLKQDWGFPGFVESDFLAHSRWGKGGPGWHGY